MHCVHSQICAHTCAYVYACAPSRFVNLRGCAQVKGNGSLGTYIVNANQQTSIKSLPAATSLFSSLPNTQYNQVLTVMRKRQQEPTCVNQFSMGRGTIMAPHSANQHSEPSKGCITSSHSAERYVIGKAHWTVYSCSLCARSRDDIITECFSHQILPRHPLSAVPSPSQVGSQP